MWLKRKKPRRQQTGHRTVSAGQGSGPLFEREFRVSFEPRGWTPERLILKLRDDFPELAPDGLLEAARRDGSHRRLDEGDELRLFLSLFVPAYVRVNEVGRNYFVFRTLRGHPEAGLIRFEATGYPVGAATPHRIDFTVTSRFRQNGILSLLAYWLLGARFMQTRTWEAFTTKVARFVVPTWTGKVRTSTRVVRPERRDEQPGRGIAA